MKLTYEERQVLRQRVSDIQREKELRVRRMWLRTRYRTKLYLGGGSAPSDQQNRSGYPPSRTSEDSPWGHHKRNKAA